MKKIFLTILALIISAISINWIYSIVNFEKVLSSLKNVSLIQILILFLIFIISFYLRIIRFYYLQQKIAKTEIKLVNQSFCINYIVNIFLPLRFGEFFRIIYLKTKQKISVFDSIFIIAIEKFNDLIVIIIFLIVILLDNDLIELYSFIFPKFENKTQNLILICLFSFSLVVLIGLLFNKNFKNKITSKVVLYKKFLFSFKLVSLTFCLTILSWSLEASLFIVSGLFLNIEGYFILGFLSVCLVALGTSIPSAPSSVGIFEGSVVLSAIILSISTSDALSLAILVHILQIVTIIFVTILVFLLPILTFYFKKLLR